MAEPLYNNFKLESCDLLASAKSSIRDVLESASKNLKEDRKYLLELIKSRLKTSGGIDYFRINKAYELFVIASVIDLPIYDMIKRMHYLRISINEYESA